MIKVKNLHFWNNKGESILKILNLWYSFKEHYNMKKSEKNYAYLLA